MINLTLLPVFSILAILRPNSHETQALSGIEDAALSYMVEEGRGNPDGRNMVSAHRWPQARDFSVSRVRHCRLERNRRSASGLPGSALRTTSPMVDIGTALQLGHLLGTMCANGLLSSIDATELLVAQRSLPSHTARAAVWRLLVCTFGWPSQAHSSSRDEKSCSISLNGEGRLLLGRSSSSSVVLV